MKSNEIRKSILNEQRENKINKSWHEFIDNVEDIIHSDLTDDRKYYFIKCHFDIAYEKERKADLEYIETIIAENLDEVREETWWESQG